MDLRDFCHAIRFRFVTPVTKIPAVLRWILECRIGVLQSLLDHLTKLPPEMERRSVSALRRIGAMPRMSTAAIGAILNECVRRMPGTSCYLNIGVWNGYSLFAGMAGNPEKRCIGVDSFTEFGGPRAAFLRRFGRLRTDHHEFHDSDWHAYMETHRIPIGVLFYDASHDPESQYAALKAAHPHIIPGGILIVDDWNWEWPKQGTSRFLQEFPEYETVFEQHTSCNGHPTFWNGILVLRKRSS